MSGRSAKVRLTCVLGGPTVENIYKTSTVVARKPGHTQTGAVT